MNLIGVGGGMSVTPLFVASSYGLVACITIVVVLMEDHVWGILE